MQVERAWRSSIHSTLARALGVCHISALYAVRVALQGGTTWRAILVAADSPMRYQLRQSSRSPAPTGDVAPPRPRVPSDSWALKNQNSSYSETGACTVHSLSALEWVPWACTSSSPSSSSAHDTRVRLLALSLPNSAHVSLQRKWAPHRRHATAICSLIRTLPVCFCMTIHCMPLASLPTRSSPLHCTARPGYTRGWSPQPYIAANLPPSTANSKAFKRERLSHILSFSSADTSLALNPNQTANTTKTNPSPAALPPRCARAGRPFPGECGRADTGRPVRFHSLAGAWGPRGADVERPSAGLRARPEPDCVRINRPPTTTAAGCERPACIRHQTPAPFVLPCALPAAHGPARGIH